MFGKFGKFRKTFWLASCALAIQLRLPSRPWPIRQCETALRALRCQKNGTNLMHQLSYSPLDVFADKPFCCNSLTVFLLETELPTRTLQQITREMRQFESIFARRSAEQTLVGCAWQAVGRHAGTAGRRLHLKLMNDDVAHHEA
jgi:hypothetical protein